MQLVRQWAFSLCAAGVVSAMIQALLPNTGPSRLMNTVLSVFMLLCVLAPISRLVPMAARQMSEGIGRNSRQENPIEGQVYDEVLIQAARSKLADLAADKLRKMGINPLDIGINIIVSGDEISVGDVELVLPYEWRRQHDSIRAQLQSELGLNVKIGYQ
jgi:hypothetical protein